MQPSSAVPKFNYSAEIRIWLEFEARSVPLSHACDIFVVAATPTRLPPGDANIVFSVNGSRYERPVNLPEGLSPEVARTPVRDRTPSLTAS